MLAASSRAHCCCCTTHDDAGSWVGGVAKAAHNSTPPQAAAGYDDSKWRELNIPHDYVIEGTFDKQYNPNHGGLPTNVSWYRKEFELDSSLEGSLVWLTFDGVYRAADVYLNGAFVGHHEDGYTSFNVYLHNATAGTKYGKGKRNVLAVYVDATESELWCYEGGGIYRHVWLESASTLSITPNGFAAPTVVNGTIYGTDPTAAQSTDGAIFLPSADIQNRGDSAASGTIVFSIGTRREGAKDTVPLAPAVVVSVSVAYTVPAGGFLRVSPALPTAFGSKAGQIRLWNTAYSPPMYTATATVLAADGATVLDAVSARIGVRSAVFDPRKGFLLNGVKVLIQGTSNHIGFGGVGIAVPDRVQEFQIATLKQMGSNAWRTAHNPVTPELLDYADEYGFLVWEENRLIEMGVEPMLSKVPSVRSQQLQQRAASSPQPQQDGWTFTPRNGSAADPTLVQNVQDMVLRDRNHPSIIIWSLCNELGCSANNPNGGVLAIQFKLAVYAADSSRPVTGNTVQTPYLGGHYVDGFSMAMDVQSFSYEYDVYAKYHATAPWKAVGGGESASCPSDRGYYGPTNRTTGHLSPCGGGQCGGKGLAGCIQESWYAAATLDYVYGNFAWTGFDYKGETSMGWPDVSSSYGIHDLAGFPKDGAGYYTAWWRDGPECGGDGGGDRRDSHAASAHEDNGGAAASASLSISPNDWTQPVPNGTPIDVVVTTCAAAVQLFLNGVPQGARPQPVPRFGFVQWPGVIFQPQGNLTAVGYSASGSIIAVKSVVAAGAATRLEVWVEAPYYAPLRNATEIAADGQDAALIGVKLLDANGVVVPNADVNVTFTVHGPAAVVGVHNGDPADHSPDKASWRNTFHGLARAIVASAARGVAGEITVVASAAGIDAGQTTLVASI